MAAQQLQKSKLRPDKRSKAGGDEGGGGPDGPSVLHDGVRPALTFPWMAVLWQRGLEHKNLQESACDADISVPQQVSGTLLPTSFL